MLRLLIVERRFRSNPHAIWMEAAERAAAKSKKKAAGLEEAGSLTDRCNECPAVDRSRQSFPAIIEDECGNNCLGRRDAMN